MPKFRPEMWHSECWFSGIGSAMVCSGGSFYFETHHNCLASVFHRPPLCLLPGRGWLEGSEIVTDLPAVCLQNGQGILLFQQITALANRTETHSLISQRPSSPETSSLTKRMQQQKRKDTWGSVVWAAGTLVTQLWSNTFPELGWVCLWAFPKEHWLWKGFQTSAHQGDYLLPDSLGT